MDVTERIKQLVAERDQTAKYVTDASRRIHQLNGAIAAFEEVQANEDVETEDQESEQDE